MVVDSARTGETVVLGLARVRRPGWGYDRGGSHTLGRVPSMTSEKLRQLYEADLAEAIADPKASREDRRHLSHLLAWSRRTPAGELVSAPRARDPAPAPGSPSPCRSRTTPRRRRRPAPARPPTAAAPACSSSTTTRGRCASCARPSTGPDSTRWPRATSGTSPASSTSSGRRSCCSTWCCLAATAFELMAQVPALAELPVIFISAYDRAETLARALDAGADDYLVKPFSATELTARVRAALRRRAGPAAFRARRVGHRLPRPPRHPRRPRTGPHRHRA